MMVCNTRQHFDDFGGKIKSREYRSIFHILHRRAWRDMADGTRKPFYEKDGLGNEKYSLRVLDEMMLVKPEHEFWSEFMNCPLDPKRQLFKPEDFQVVDIDDPRVPIEVSAGLGRPVTQAEQLQLDALRRKVWAYNCCDPAGKEEQSVRGDDTAAGGFRFDAAGNIWVTWLDCGQWDSDQVWEHLFMGHIRNRPLVTDYEEPASALHLRAAYEAWKARKSADLGGMPITMLLDLQKMPKTGKHGRIENLTGWTKNKQVFILRDCAPEPILRKFIRQHVGYPLETHDDFPDMFSRVLRFAQPRSAAEIEAARKANEGPRIENGVMKVTLNQLLDSVKAGPGGTSPNWGLQGRKGRAA
jgi:hypothetical protein